jgi:hypothetical protein
MATVYYTKKKPIATIVLKQCPQHHKKMSVETNKDATHEKLLTISKILMHD